MKIICVGRAFAKVIRKQGMWLSGTQFLLQQYVTQFKLPCDESKISWTASSPVMLISYTKSKCHDHHSTCSQWTSIHAVTFMLELREVDLPVMLIVDLSLPEWSSTHLSSFMPWSYHSERSSVCAWQSRSKFNSWSPHWNDHWSPHNHIYIQVYMHIKPLLVSCVFGARSGSPQIIISLNYC